MHQQSRDQYGNRQYTDAQVPVSPSPCQYNGLMDTQARFIEQNQLFQQHDWELFVEQFKQHSDDEDNGWRGEYFGKMMRGACMTYQYTQSESLYMLLTQIVQQMLTAQDTDGRFSTYSTSKEFSGWDLWSRKYVLLGLLHYYHICRDEAMRDNVLSALTKHLDYIVQHIYTRKIDLSTTSSYWRGINSASILEPVVRMYNLTGKKEYLLLAEYIVDFLYNGKTNIFALALENECFPYQYPVTKAYEIMSCFEGLLEYYRVTGIEKWKTAVVNFVDAVKESDITIIGCAGCEHELFNHAAATQTDTGYTGIMQETCVTVTWMKLCNQLLMLTGEAKYADYMEQSFYNALYGAINNEKVQTKDNFLFDSYSPLTLGVRGRATGGYKKISDDRYYGCCVAIGAAGTSLPLHSAVTKTKTGIAFNFYEKGTVRIDGMEFVLDTEYPADGAIRIMVTKATGCITELQLRIPAFSSSCAQVFINGIPHTFQSSKGAFYLSLCRNWSPGDQIDLVLDMACRILRPQGVAGKPETEHFFAVVHGPLVLARDARIGETGTALDVCEPISLTPCTTAPVPCTFCANVTLGNQTIRMIDYGSAGKTWDETSRMEAWIRTNT